MNRRTWIAAIVAPIVVAAIALTAVTTAGSASAASTRNFYVTLYGWPDNSPPGDGTAFGSGHAGGTGTYANPVTFATDQNELAPNTIVYYPYLHRYFIMQDECTECDEDWANGKYHIDLWIGGQNGNVNDVLNCEDALTQDSSQVVLSPPSNEPVDTTPLFNSSSNKCYNPSSFTGGTPTPTPTGGGTGNSYVGGASGKCIDDPNSSTTNSTQLQIYTCHGSSNQKFTATGGTLQVLGKCMDAYNNQTANNTKVEIYSCNGGQNQQWTYSSSSGTITGAQSGKCLTVQGAATGNGALLILYTCNGGTNQKWTRQ